MRGGVPAVGSANVRHYALQPFWRDGHSIGIYRFELLGKLGNDDV